MIDGHGEGGEYFQSVATEQAAAFFGMQNAPPFSKRFSHHTTIPPFLQEKTHFAVFSGFDSSILGENGL